MKPNTFISFLLISIAGILIVSGTGCRDWDVGPDPPEEHRWYFTDIDIETRSASSAMLSWNGHTTSPLITLLNFGIFRSTDSGTFIRIAVIDAKFRSYFESELSTQLHDYMYYVEAITDSGSFLSPQIKYTFACGYDSYTDTRDGTTYNTLSDGYRCWFTENLKYMPEVHPPDDFSTSSARYYVYGYNGYNISQARVQPNYQSYGVLYNYPAIQNACPVEKGWRVATPDDWRTLISISGGGAEAGGALKETDTTHWKHPNTGATNIFNFTALPGGSVDSIRGFYEIREAAHFWAADASAYTIFYHGTGIFTSHQALGMAGSLRCVKDFD